MGTIKVVSFNIRCCDDKNGHSILERAPRLYESISRRAPDVIGIQEYRPRWEEHFEKYFLDEYEIFNKYRCDKHVESAPILWKRSVFECLDKGFAKNEQIDVVVRPEDVDVVAVDKGMLTGVVSSVTFKGVHYEIIVDIGGFKWMIQTTDYVAPNATIGLYIEPDAIHIMKKSEFSDMFGDYSSFSEEMDHLSDIEEEE